MAIADLDGDGRLDVVINNNNSTPTVYINNLRRVGKHIDLRLVGTRSNRDAIGARVRLSAGGKIMTRQIEAGSGFASEATLAAHFGLGDAERIDSVEIIWPSGLTEKFSPGQLDAFIGGAAQIEEGSGRVAEARAAKGPEMGPYRARR